MTPDLEFKVFTLKAALGAITAQDLKRLKADPLNSGLLASLPNVEIPSQTLENDALDRQNQARISVGLPEI
jgi:hypothetical protein